MSINEAQKVLKKYFGYESFRPMQAEIIEAIFAKKDSLVLMPSGGGKSLCFQVPAIVMPGICLVVSPLIALMKDQVDGLKINGVSAAFLNSSLSPDELNEVENQAIKGELKLLYVSPEKLLSAAFVPFLKKLKINLFAIDEAHCISSWGHDFRPEYTKLKIIKKEFPDIPVVALTATADRLTRKDISEQLELNNPETFLASFDRPNISLSVLPGQDRSRVIIEFIRNRQGQSGIIYCLSKKSTEQMAEKLNKAGIKAGYYHAGLSSEKRSKIQDDFINDRIPVICATIAFGMGIDKSDVRWVIHYNLPKNIEGYYQEIGRAGRDGVDSEALLFYTFADVIALRGFLEDSGQKEYQMAKLERMQQYADSLICRRKIMLSYFSENMAENCNNCDACNDPPAYFDATIIVQKALSAITRLKQKVASGTVIDVLRGSGKHEIFENNYHEIKTYGAGKDIPYQDWQQYLLQMLNLGLIEVAYDENQALKLTESSRDVLYNGKTVNLIQLDSIKKKAEERIKKAQPVSKQQQIRNELFEVLRQLRKEISSEAKIPPYQVFSDATLEQMSIKRPITESEMKNISGVGEKKYNSYGEIFINRIFDFIKDQRKQGAKIKGSTYAETFEYYRNGLSPEEIATERELNIGTIYGHLTHLYENDYAINLAEFIPEEDMDRILKAIDTTKNTTSLKDLFVYLNEEVDYYKIKIALAYRQKQLLNR
jgi:ATP-dependent DNA helicase RecQ